MEEKNEMLELMRKMEENSRKQLLYTRIQCAAAVIAVVCFAGIFFLIRDLLPQVSAIMADIPGLVTQLERVLANLEVVTGDLATVDFETMVTGINALVSTGQVSLEETVAKLNAIDFESLNTAIGNLSAVVEPMASFFKVFG